MRKSVGEEMKGEKERGKEEEREEKWRREEKRGETGVCGWGDFCEPDVI